MLRFDAKFGKEFIGSVPKSPGVYFIYAEDGSLLYVGKAKDLRRRLNQYRKANRGKRARKMRALVKDGARIEWRLCTTDLDACLLEIEMIQKLRPPRNVQGAFAFLYPLIGLRQNGEEVEFVFTTLPSEFEGVRFFGAYRSREMAVEAFFALMRLLRFVGHRSPRRASEADETPEYSYVVSFRRLPASWLPLWEDFFRGRSTAALEALVLKMLENAGARAKAAEVQGEIKSLRQFWKWEAVPLARAIETTAYAHYPVPQHERDPLFLRAGYATLEPSLAATPEMEKDTST